MSDITYEVSNYYVFCVSSVLSYSLGQEFCGEDDTSIITIPSIVEFYGAVTDAMAEYAHPAGYGQIRYVHGQYDYRQFGSINPAYVKQTNYAHQGESRMLWTPISKIKEFVEIASNNIARTCYGPRTEY